MNKIKAFLDARKLYPERVPGRMLGVSPTSDGRGVIIAGHENLATLAIYDRGDLLKLKIAVEVALLYGKSNMISAEQFYVLMVNGGTEISKLGPFETQAMRDAAAKKAYAGGKGGEDNVFWMNIPDGLSQEIDVGAYLEGDLDE